MKEDQTGSMAPTDAADGMFCANPAQSSEARRCGAKTRNGGTCRKPCVPGRSRCRLHNGNAKRGTEHPNFRNGLYSKCLNRDLRAEYTRLLRNPALLSSRSDIAALRVRLNQLAARLESGESSRRWGEVREALAELRAATGAGDEPRASAAIARLDALVNGEHDDEGAWNDMAEMIDRVSVLCAREHRKLIEERLTCSVEEVRVLTASITKAICTYVTDVQVRRAISEHVKLLRVLPADEIDRLVRDTMPVSRESLDGMAAGAFAPTSTTVEGDDEPEGDDDERT